MGTCSVESPQGEFATPSQLRHTRSFRRVGQQPFGVGRENLAHLTLTDHCQSSAPEAGPRESLLHIY